MSRKREQAIFVAGHRGMVGSALTNHLKQAGYRNILTANRRELDLRCAGQVNAYFSHHHIDQVYLAAAKVGGIHANNSYPADFIADNLLIETSIIKAAHDSNVQKLLFLGSSCIYPKLADQPIIENELLAGQLEPTNEPYAIAKITGIKLCESFNRQFGRDYRSVMPTNLYGPNDNFHAENAHVVPALMRRIHEAKQYEKKEVVIWGSGTPLREFLHVDDMASASIHVMELSPETYQAHTKPMLSHINVGTGKETTIEQLARIIAQTVGYQGRLTFDQSKPDGTPRKLLDVSLLGSLGWHSRITLEAGLKDTYHWFCENKSNIRM